MSTCAFPNCRTFVRDGKYCPGHAKIMRSSNVPDDKPKQEKNKSEKKPVTKKKAIGKRAKKMTKAVRVLKKVATEFLALPENNICAIQSPVCTQQATCVNHKAGRIGKKLTDTKYMEPSCAPCNGWIEENNEIAMQQGHKVSRLAKSSN